MRRKAAVSAAPPDLLPPGADEVQSVAVRIADREGGTPPGLFFQTAVHLDARRQIFGEQALDVLDVDERREQAFLLDDSGDERRLVHEAQMQSRATARHRAIERRITVQEVDAETELVPKEIRRRPDIRDE